MISHMLSQIIIVVKAVQRLLLAAVTRAMSSKYWRFLLCYQVLLPTKPLSAGCPAWSSLRRSSCPITFMNAA